MQLDLKSTKPAQAFKNSRITPDTRSQALTRQLFPFFQVFSAPFLVISTLAEPCPWLSNKN